MKFLVVFSGLWLWLPLQGQAAWLSEDQAIMGTNVSVSVWHQDSALARRAIDAVLAEMRRIDKTYTSWQESSDLSRLNQRAAIAPQAISAEMKLLLQASRRASEITSGAFDITYASVGHLYDYREGKRPDKEQIEAKKTAIDYRFVEIKDNTVFFRHPNVVIGLGGIAKGYAVDQAIDILRKMGIAHASVSAGGDSRLLGDRLGRPWIVGIKNPRPGKNTNKENEVALRIPLSDAAISTSGDYERYFIDESTKERVHHIINPRSGKSATGITSVTIIGSEGLQTDPLSTGVFVLGVKKGLAMINKIPEVDVIIIDSQGKVHFSEGLSP